MDCYRSPDTNSTIFFVKLPPLQQFCHVVLKLDKNHSSYFQGQVLKCRQLLFLCRDVIASPNLLEKSLIDVVMSAEYFREKKFHPVCKKLSLQPLQACEVKLNTLQSCFGYTVKFRMSYMWNQINNFLVKGPDVVRCTGKLEAIDMDISVCEEQITVALKPCMIRNPPPSLGNFDISIQAIRQFENDENSTIEDFSIYRSWCFILPTMKRGQLVRVSHKMPVEKHPNGPPAFTDYPGLKKYWKNHYGIRLPESEEGIVYCSIYFKLIGQQLFTYPLCCVRTRAIQIMPRCDGPSIVKEFMSFFQQKMDKLCGIKLIYSTKPCYFTNKLSEAVQIKPGRLQNVTMNIAEVRHKITPLPSRPTFPHPSPMNPTPHNKDIIPSSQVSNAFEELKKKVENEYPASQVILSSQNEEKHRRTMIKALPMNASGKFIPVFATRKHSVTITSGNKCGKKIDNTIISKIRSYGKDDVKGIMTSSCYQKATFNEMTLKRRKEINRHKAGIGSVSSKFVNGRYKTPSKISGGLNDSGYDSNETPAPVLKKDVSNITLTRRYLPKKLSFSNNVIASKPPMQNHSFDKLFSKAGGTQCEDPRGRENHENMLTSTSRSPLKIMKNHSFDKLFATARSFGNEDAGLPTQGHLEINPLVTSPVVKNHEFDKLFQSASKGLRFTGKDQIPSRDLERQPFAEFSSNQRTESNGTANGKYSFDRLFATASSLQTMNDLPGSSSNNTEKHLEHCNTHEYAVPDIVRKVVPSFGKKRPSFPPKLPRKKHSFDQLFKSASAGISEIVKSSITNSANRRELNDILVSEIVSVENLSKTAARGHILEETLQAKLIKRKLPNASPSLTKRTKIKTDVSVEEMARGNKLSKVNAATLSAWLKSQGVVVKCKDKKDDLVTKVQMRLQL